MKTVVLVIASYLVSIAFITAATVLELHDHHWAAGAMFLASLFSMPSWSVGK